MQAELGGNEAMTCQELLALSGALSAALPTGQLALDSFLNSLTKGKFFLFFLVFFLNSFSLRKFLRKFFLKEGRVIIVYIFYRF